MKSRGKMILFADADGASKFADFERLENALKSSSDKFEVSFKAQSFPNPTNLRFISFFFQINISNIHKILCPYLNFIRKKTLLCVVRGVHWKSSRLPNVRPTARFSCTDFTFSSGSCASEAFETRNADLR